VVEIAKPLLADPRGRGGSLCRRKKNKPFNLENRTELPIPKEGSSHSRVS
jgi:hypothetical protein